MITDLDEVYSPDMVAEVAERMSFLEGTKWSLAYASYRNQLYFSLRTKDRRMNAGRMIREVCENVGGSAGGHGSMAGARLPLSGNKAQRNQFKRSGDNESGSPGLSTDPGPPSPRDAGRPQRPHSPRRTEAPQRAAAKLGQNIQRYAQDERAHPAE